MMSAETLSAGGRNDRSRKLTDRQHLAAIALVATGDLTAAATAGGCSPRTLRRWRHLAAFQAVATNEARDLAREARLQALALAGEAVQTLRRNLTDPAPPAVQVRAAAVVLEAASRVAVEHDILERVAALEAVRWHDDY